LCFICVAITSMHLFAFTCIYLHLLAFTLQSLHVVF
jgi:hypothetical protein